MPLNCLARLISDAIPRHTRGILNPLGKNRQVYPTGGFNNLRTSKARRISIRWKCCYHDATELGRSNGGPESLFCDLASAGHTSTVFGNHRELNLPGS